MNDAAKGQVNASAAEVYDEFFVPALFDQWPPHLIEAAQIEPSHHVLDVACGTGVLTRAVHDRVGPEGAVVGLDLNEGMLATAKAKASDIVWRLGRAEELPFEPEIFDRVVSQFGLMFFEDPPAAVSEMYRVLRPGGTMAVAVWSRLEETPGYAAVADLLGRLFGKEAADAIRAPYVMGDADRLAALFEEATGSSAHVRTVRGEARFDSLDAWMHTDVKGWTLAEILDEAQYETLRDRARVELADFVTESGHVRFAAPAHIVAVTK